MNREIKFRAWCKSEKKMLTVQQVLFDFDNNVLKEWTHQKSKVKFLQYAGLKDPNGVDIYEGDIIDLCQSKYEGEHNFNVVVFENGCFCAKDKLTSRNLHETISIGIDYEVIGNIYENPEIITGRG